MSSAAKQSKDGLVPERQQPIDLEGISLSQLQTLLDKRERPPVDLWNPQRCGHSGMRIARDGTWFHDGEPVRRAAMVRLFSSILRREPDGSHVLVTPVEKLEIDVENTAFRAVTMIREGERQEQRLAFGLDNGDPVILGPDHPLRLVQTPHGLSPRVLVRHGLEAELTRSVYYELAELAITDGAEPAGIWSEGIFFPLDDAR